MLVFIITVIVILCATLIFIVLDGNEEKKAHKILYDKANRRLVVDDVFVIACFRDGSLNHELFEYLYEHPHKSICYSELKLSIFKGREVDLNKIIDAMGFKMDLKNLLFSFDAGQITYHPQKFEQHTGLVSIK